MKATNSETVRDTLRLREQCEEIRQLELGRLKPHFDEGKASGKGHEIDRSAFMASLKAERAARGQV